MTTIAAVAAMSKQSKRRRKLAKRIDRKGRELAKFIGWRQAAVDRLEAFCGLNPQAIGVGKSPIVGCEWWVNRHAKAEK